MIELVGGPRDGEQLERSSRPSAFVWIDANLRCHSAPADDRSLYRFAGSKPGPAGRVWLYEFSEHTLERCNECGWFGPAGEACVVCGRPF